MGCYTERTTSQGMADAQKAVNLGKKEENAKLFTKTEETNAETLVTQADLKTERSSEVEPSEKILKDEEPSELEQKSEKAMEGSDKKSEEG